MASNTFGEIFRVTTFGESHGKGIGAVIDGVPAQFELDIEAIQKDLDRRRPGRSKISPPRKEQDKLEVLSGIFEGKTLGSPLALWIQNEEFKSSDYDALKNIFRPGHADFSWWKKFGHRDWRGGGRSSGRETVARVAAGSVAKQFLARESIRVRAHVIQIGKVCAQKFDELEIDNNALYCGDKDAAAQMEQAIIRAQADKDSLGGVIQVEASFVPAGLGDPVFDKLEARLGAALFSIGGVKGVEFGDGFSLATQFGSQTNDPILENGFASNHMGGILGGISNGETIVARVAVKPTPSIGKAQNTIDTDGKFVEVKVDGRHDPCLCPRIVVVVESMVNLVLYDALLRQKLSRY